MATKRTIIASGEGIRYEFTADAAISPGDLIIQTATGCIRHATAASKVTPLFAIEDEIFGRGVNTGSGYQAINAGVDYASGDRVLAEACHAGMIVNVTIGAAAAAIVLGDYLESAGTGALRKTTTVANAIAIAQEAMDNSAGASVVRIGARII